MRLIWIAAIGLLGACGGRAIETGQDPPIVEEPTIERAEFHSRFVGTWTVVTDGYHAHPVDIELRKDGSMLIHGQGCLATGLGCVSWVHFESDEVQWSQGSLASYTVNCQFGSQWRSIGASTLVIAASCSDDVNRELFFDFRSLPSSNAEPGASVVLKQFGALALPNQKVPEILEAWNFRKQP